jgi:hypothetical protein
MACCLNLKLGIVVGEAKPCLKKFEERTILQTAAY